MAGLTTPCTDHGLSGNKPQGYHQVRLNGKLVYVHRLALAEALNVPIHKLRLVRHLCHNPRCVNPLHLAEGTHQDNANDRVEAGRSAKVQLARRILTPEQEAAVCSIYATKTSYHGSVSYESLAIDFNTTKRNIELVIKRGKA